MATYALMFSPDGRNPVTVTVPEGKALYLVRAEQAAGGTATVKDVLTLDDYVLEDGVTVCRTNAVAGSTLHLVFLARSNPRLSFVNAEVITPRPGSTPCG